MNDFDSISLQIDPPTRDRDRKELRRHENRKALLFPLSSGPCRLAFISHGPYF
jgi:hypothetical protein